MNSLIRWEPFGDLVSLRDAMDRLFEDSFVPTRRSSAALHSGQLAVDLFETDDSVVLKTGIAGISPDDIDITISGNVVTIKGETKAEHETEEGRYYRRELRYGSFQRSVTLPEIADPDAAEASYENGVLTLTLAKKAEAKPKQIKVEAKGS